MIYKLRRTWLPGDGPPDDYVVRVGRRDIGRIYRTFVPNGYRWRWSIYINQHVHRVDAVPSAGLAPNLEQAKSAFRARFDHMAAIRKNVLDGSHRLKIPRALIARRNDC